MAEGVDVIPSLLRLVSREPCEEALNSMRILSLDGGGTLAGVHARTLGAIFGGDTPGRDIIGQFQLVARNSGGSVVLTTPCCN